MIIGIDNSPLVSTHKLAHKIRGTGFYTKNLIEALEKFHPENEYTFFVQGEKVKKKIDLIHYPYFEPFFLSLPFRKKIKSIVTIHDLTPLVFPEMFPVGIKGNMKYFLQKKLAQKCDAIITDSESSKRDIQKIMGIPSEKIFSVPLAAASHFKKLSISDSDKKEIINKYRLPEKFALYVGDATPNKNLKNIIDACLLSHVPLVLAGGALGKADIVSHPWNKDLLYVQELAKKNSEINILGFVSDGDLVKLYNMASVFVFPSLYEGFGLPILEAAACGCPIVTSKKGSIPEVAGDAGYYVDPHSVKEIAESISLFLDNKDLRSEYSKRGIKQAEKFSWEKTADSTVKVYEKIFNKT